MAKYETHSPHQPWKSLTAPKSLKTIVALLLGCGLLLCWACIERPQTEKLPNGPDPDPPVFPPEKHSVDMLFVIDDSSSMQDAQETLQAQFSRMLDRLADAPGGLPDLHIGVASTDLGTGPYTSLHNCEEFGGDQGILGRVKGQNRGESCIGPDQRYIVDVEPPRCLIEKDSQGRCTAHECTAQNCDQAAYGREALTLVTDEDGCPRCRNYEGPLAETFSCLAALGTTGCGFEQPLEAMYRALSQSETPENDGFLRQSAYLAAILVTDEDDCSAAHPDILFNPDPNEDRIDSTLGPLNSFRCFEFGVTCDENARALPGPRNNCVPREDDGALLHSISRYTAYLEALKVPRKIVVAAIAGPVEDAVVVQKDAHDRPQLKSTCVGPSGHGATPGVRLRAFVDHFNNGAATQAWAYSSVCDGKFDDALTGIGDKLVSALSEKCPAQPFAGCSRGPAGTSCRACLPQCTVYDEMVRTTGENTSETVRFQIPWCSTICRHGPCKEGDMQACAFDPNGKCTCPQGLRPTLFEGKRYCAPLLYLNPPDTERDPRLLSLLPQLEPAAHDNDPTTPLTGRASACWYLTENTQCPHFAGFRIIRGQDPAPQTHTQANCAVIPPSEHLCHDHLDNDEDCWVDSDDPDCI
jgi:hypothetical protein